MLVVNSVVQCIRCLLGMIVMLCCLLQVVIVGCCLLFVVWWYLIVWFCLVGVVYIELGWSMIVCWRLGFGVYLGYLFCCLGWL